MLRFGRNIVLIVILVLVVLAIMGRDFYVRRTLSYELTSDALVISYRGEQVLPYRGIKTVTFLREPPRISGSWLAAIGESRIGSFQVEGVKGPVQIFAARAKSPLIVVDLNLMRYGLAPDNPEAFYRQLLARIERSSPEAHLGQAK